jgi:dihydropteroate synthase
MIPCICIDDKGRPGDFPLSKWIKEQQEYHVTSVITVLPQNELGVTLAEIELDATCYPYKFFLAKRFGFTKENFQKLIELVQNTNETKEFDYDILIKEQQKQKEYAD